MILKIIYNKYLKYKCKYLLNGGAIPKSRKDNFELIKKEDYSKENIINIRKFFSYYTDNNIENIEEFDDGKIYCKHLIRMYHPDKLTDKTAEKIKKAEEITILLIDILNDINSKEDEQKLKMFVNEYNELKKKLENINILNTYTSIKEEYDANSKIFIALLRNNDTYFQNKIKKEQEELNNIISQYYDLFKKYLDLIQKKKIGSSYINTFINYVKINFVNDAKKYKFIKIDDKYSMIHDWYYETSSL